MIVLIDSITESLPICLHTMPMLLGTLIIVDALSEFGIINRCFFLVSPIAKVSRLSHASTLALITSIGSSISANSMTAQFLKNGSIGTKEALISIQANSIPAYIKEILTYFLPVVIPLLGFGPGILYILGFFLTLVLKITFIVIAGRYLVDYHVFDSPVNSQEPVIPKEYVSNWKASLGKRFKKTGILVMRILLLLFIATVCIKLLEKYNLFNHISLLVSPIMALLDIPEKLFVPICTYLGSPIAGAAGIGSFYKLGEIALYGTTIAALIGGTISLIVITIRYSIPHYIALFGPRIGGANVMISLGLALFSRFALVILLFSVLPHS